MHAKIDEFLSNHIAIAQHTLRTLALTFFDRRAHNYDVFFFTIYFTISYTYILKLYSITRFLKLHNVS